MRRRWNGCSARNSDDVLRAAVALFRGPGVVNASMQVLPISYPGMRKVDQDRMSSMIIPLKLGEWEDKH